MITIVDYKMGNIRSLLSALSYLGCDSILTNDHAVIQHADKIILPGVGAFDAAMRNLQRLHLIEPLNEIVIGRKKQALGICLGMQILATCGEENGLTEGLGWVSGKVTKMAFDRSAIRVPHIGFNSVRVDQAGRELFSGLEPVRDYYFVHSYHMQCDHPEDIAATVEYGEQNFVAAIHHENVFGVQFHPEKSQSNGLTLLRNFILL